MPQITDRIRATKVLDEVLKTLEIDVNALALALFLFFCYRNAINQ